ncbi:RRM domain-containing protein [Mycena chlorophos]|uniref:RRM domain-containing protein n=1 Tax=Mycena chlorophos TaxID=658473 RepID=A0A8H6VXU4_MYCCL|nr:RRM domain-containing protein [Mycena chlorophos]
MNVVREINRINDRELELGASGASWHDEFKDSAYIFVGGLNFELTEGDVITIFSQYGEVMDVNMPRDKDTGKRRGFAFIMYEDQRSTVLAVDNLNGAQVLEKTLRVDHVKNYKQAKVRNEDGEMVEPDEQSFNAKPELIYDDAGAESDSSASTGASIDPEDPMRDFLIAQRREEKALGKKSKSKSKSKSKKSSKHKDETPEERKARKAAKKQKKARKAAQGQSDGVRGVQDLLSSLGGADFLRSRRRSASPGPARRRSRSPPPRREYSPKPYSRNDRSRSPPPYRPARDRERDYERPRENFGDRERDRDERERDRCDRSSRDYPDRDRDYRPGRD